MEMGLDEFIEKIERVKNIEKELLKLMEGRSVLACLHASSYCAFNGMLRNKKEYKEFFRLINAWLNDNQGIPLINFNESADNEESEVYNLIDDIRNTFPDGTIIKGEFLFSLATVVSAIIYHSGNPDETLRKLEDNLRKLQKNSGGKLSKLLMRFRRDK